MQNEWLYVGYMAAFFAVYLGSVLLSLYPTIVHAPTPSYYSTSYMSTMNATVSGTAGISSWLPIIGVVVAGGIVVSVLVSAFSFKRGL